MTYRHKRGLRRTRQQARSESEESEPQVVLSDVRSTTTKATRGSSRTFVHKTTDELQELNRVRAHAVG